MDILKSMLEIKCLYAISILMVMSATVSFSTTNLGGPLRNCSCDCVTSDSGVVLGSKAEVQVRWHYW